MAPRPSTLSQEAIASRLASLPHWQQAGGALVRTYEFPAFAAAVAFVTRVAEAAEAADHHPDIDIRYRRVRLALSTHDAGGITELDFSLANTADRIFA